jgi:hypothetical protein
VHSSYPAEKDQLLQRHEVTYMSQPRQDVNGVCLKGHLVQIELLPIRWQAVED